MKKKELIIITILVFIDTIICTSIYTSSKDLNNINILEESTYYFDYINKINSKELKNITISNEINKPIIKEEYMLDNKITLNYVPKPSTDEKQEKNPTEKKEKTPKNKKKDTTKKKTQSNKKNHEPNKINNNDKINDNDKKDDQISSKVQYFTTSKGFKGYTKDGLTYIDGYLIVNKTYSLPSSYGSGLTKTTKDAFNKMRAAATLEGLNIYLSSGFRSYNTQKNLYNRYVKRDGKKKADTFSARPGHSEHQTGLALDVNQINSTFNNSPEAKWLANNCYKYGFILRYPNGKTNETGYKYESWHFRYVGQELAKKLYNNGNWITMEDYFGITSTY